MVSDGDRVTVHYVARLVTDGDAGPLLDTTDVDVALSTDSYYGQRDYEPLAFTVGDGTVLPAVEDVVRSLEPGESVTFTVDADDAFGAWSADRVVEVPRAALEERSETDASVGELVVSERGDAGWITGVDGDTVEVDFNHELAGERIQFEVRLLDATADPAGGRDDAEREP